LRLAAQVTEKIGVHVELLRNLIYFQLKRCFGKNMASIFGSIKNLWNQINPKFGFIDAHGRIVCKPSNTTELLKYIRTADVEHLKLNMHSGRIRLMLQDMSAEYLYEQVRTTIQERDVAIKFKNTNPKLFKEK
jgi:hypothetical protein